MMLPPDVALRRSNAIASARRWVGTPYVRGAALRGAGADCLGLIEGVALDVCGRVIRPRGAFRPDWSAVTDLLAEGEARGFLPIPVAEVQPGDVVAIRYTRGTPEHLAIMTSERHMVHASEIAGVVEVPLAQLRRRIAAAAVFPGPLA